MKKNAYQHISQPDKKNINDNSQNDDLLIGSLRYKQNHTSSIMSSLFSIASTFYYNYYPINPKFTDAYFNSIDWSLHPHLFDKGFHNQKDFDNELFSLFYMTYRNNINPMYTKNDLSSSSFTTDCGWGCMIRSTQMILAKGLYDLKKITLSKDNISQCFQYQSIKKLREDILLLFVDNSIPIEEAICSEEFQYFFKRTEAIASKYSLQSDIEEVIAPFSIQTIGLVAQSIGKWTSGITMINTIIDINRQLYNEIKLIHHHTCNGRIRKQLLYDTFCIQITCNCDINSIIPKLCHQCLQNEIAKDKEHTIITYKEITYKFKQRGIIFISMRLGLNVLEKEYLKDVKSLFDIKNNIGFIGGKDNRAYYFIGYSRDNFLFIDPHFNQDTIDLAKKDFSSYSIKDIYLLKPSELSPELTLGIIIHNLNDLHDFIKEIKKKRSENYIISIDD